MRRVRISGQAVVCCVMLAIFGGMVFQAASFPPGARLLPFVIGIPAIGLTLLQLVIELRRAATEPHPEGDENAPSVRREAALIAWFVGLIGAVLLLGFMVGGTLFIGCFTRLFAKEPWRVVLAASAFAFVVVYGVFERLLDIVLFQGFLLDPLLG